MDRFEARTNDLVVEELDDGLVVYDVREAKAHWLNPSATAVWRACRDSRTRVEIVDIAGTDEASCDVALSRLIDLGLVERESGSGYSRRVVLRTAAKVGLGGAIAAPIISAVVPVAAAHASVGPRPPASQCLTPGFWKNHQSQTSGLLPQTLGHYVVGSFTAAVAVFGQMNFSASNALGGLAGHLLATELNLANGAPTNLCIGPAVSQANGLLIAAGYNGPDGTYNLTSAQRNLAVALGGELDSYNNNRLTC